MPAIKLKDRSSDQCGLQQPQLGQRLRARIVAHPEPSVEPHCEAY
jgi:hypothetical protein